MSKSKRFRVMASNGITPCDCPEQLCTHDNGLRRYRSWIVWDDEHQDNAIETSPDVEPEYRWWRDAAVKARELNGI